MKRYAIVVNARSLREVEAYLPENYRVIHEYLGGSIPGKVSTEYVIEGEDKAGWTLDGFVIPRLASGVLFAREVDLSHPVFKSIPATA